jgi:hypothetical protein
MDLRRGGWDRVRSPGRIEFCPNGRDRTTENQTCSTLKSQWHVRLVTFQGDGNTTAGPFVIALPTPTMVVKENDVEATNFKAESFQLRHSRGEHRALQEALLSSETVSFDLGPFIKTANETPSSLHERAFAATETMLTFSDHSYLVVKVLSSNPAGVTTVNISWGVIGEEPRPGPTIGKPTKIGTEEETGQVKATGRPKPDAKKWVN